MRNANVDRYRDWGITILRVVVGIVFMMHGGQKLFINGFDSVAAGFGKMGIPAPMLSAVVVTLVEFVGGALLVLGLLTRWAALLIAIDMLVAIVVVHLKNGFFLPGGYEYALTLFAASTGLALTGAGAFAVDNLIWKRGTSAPLVSRAA